MSNRLEESIRTTQKGAHRHKLILMVGIALLFSICVAVILISEIKLKHLQAEIHSSNQVLIGALHKIGFGGGIHHFKNYILRRQANYYDESKRDFQTAKSNLNAFRNMGPGLGKGDEIDAIVAIIDRYLVGLERAKKEIASDQLSIVEVDRIVKVDDTPAIVGIRALLDGLAHSEQKARSQSAKLLQAILIVICLAFFAVWLLYRTESLRLKKADEQIDRFVNELKASFAENKIKTKQLEVANEELAQFVYRTSHDLKSPLTTINGLAKYLLADIRSQNLDEAETNIERIMNESKRLSKFISEILTLSRCDSGSTERSDVDLCQVLDDIFIQLADFSESRGVRLINAVEADSLLKANETRMTQVLTNLVENGIKYSDPQKSDRFVEVSSIQRDGMIFQLIVKDNGIGMSEEAKSKAFEMFSRFHPEVWSGTGLGLHIVKKHVVAMGADIVIDSSAGDTKFIITFSNGEAV